MKKCIGIGIVCVMLLVVLAACMNDYGDTYSSSYNEPTYDATYFHHQTINDYSTGHVYDWTDSHGYRHHVSSCSCSSRPVVVKKRTTVIKTTRVIRTSSRSRR